MKVKVINKSNYTRTKPEGKGVLEIALLLKKETKSPQQAITEICPYEDGLIFCCGNWYHSYNFFMHK